MSSEKTDLFSRLYGVDVSKDVKVTQNQRYVPWNKALAGMMHQCPEMEYKIHENNNGVPFFDSPVGVFVKTSVTIGMVTRSMWRPVLNTANKAMKTEGYSYKVKEYQQGKWTGKMVDKHVEAATTTDVNEAIMRCLVKNFAVFGYGLHVYTGDNAPEPMMIDSNQLKELTALASELKINISDFNKAWSINNLASLYEFNFDAAKKYMQDMVK